MGCVNIDFDHFPQQSETVGKDVRVCYNFNTRDCHLGKIIRSDSEEPYLTVIRLVNGRVLLDSECQYQILD